MIRVVFFGSTLDSILIADAFTRAPLATEFQLTAIITQPPRPVGRSQEITPTPIQTWAEQHALSCVSFESDSKKPWLYAHTPDVVNTLDSLKADLVVSASYGQLIPYESIEKARYKGVNVHPSLLPRWRGADPVPWTLLSDDQQTGVTLVGLSKEFDAGVIYAQQKIPVDYAKTPVQIRSELFQLGAEILIATLPSYCNGSSKPIKNSYAPTYARKISKNDGFIPWALLQTSMRSEQIDLSEMPELFQKAQSHASSPWDSTRAIARAVHALAPWPGVWTTIDHHHATKRLKILRAHEDSHTLVLDQVQLEGKTPVSWDQFSRAYFPNEH